MSLKARRCQNGHLSYPPHPRCAKCGAGPGETIDLTDRTATVVTWTVSHATPPGVRDPNPVAIVEFDIDGQLVRAIGGLTTEEIESGAIVRPVYVDELRDPTAGIRAAASQTWDGYRFEPVD